MSTSPIEPLAATPRLTRSEMVAGCVAFTILVVVGRSIAPSAGRAGTVPVPAAPAFAAPAERPLGAINTSDLRLEIIDSAAAGILYRVRTGAGVLLADGLTRSQLAERFPTLNPAALHGSLMIAEPTDDR
ncbi:MAG TPA: hypothetical protein VD971_13690 [Phycisphaerales bacterium]|nr:hypothetical protein [Phycisphaerales bacterium]